MKIVETTLFTKQIEKLIGDDAKQLLLDELINKPDAGAIIKGSGGIRNYDGAFMVVASEVESESYIIGKLDG